MSLTFNEWLNTITPYYIETLGFYDLKVMYLSECNDTYIKTLEEDHKKSVKHADYLIEENRKLEAQLFDLNKRYEILLDNYNSVFN